MSAWSSTRTRPEASKFDVNVVRVSWCVCRYVAAFYCPDDMGENRLDLVIDAADVGNETRYINRC